MWRVVGTAFLVAGCFGTPHIQDAPAPRDFYSQVRPEPSRCKRLVERLSLAEASRRPHQEISLLSASCSPGSRSVCERRLLERACALDSDAIVVLDAEPGPVPPGASCQSLISVNARAIRFKEQ